MQEIIEEYLELANELKPHLPKAVDTIIEYGSEVRRLLEALTDAAVDFRIRAIERYTKAGYDIDTAVLLTIDTSHAIKEALDKFSQKKS